VVVSAHYFDNAANIATARNLIQTLNIGNGGLVGICDGRARRFIRFSWHDASTTNVEDCTGGLDGSIMFEDPNLGFVSNNPRPVWNQFRTDINTLNAATCGLVGESCRADLIALAAIEAIQSCGGPYIEFAHGRQDSSIANLNHLTPGETESLDDVEDKFSRMGINKHDEILALIGGGHTVARHAIPNPNLPPNPNAPPFFPLPAGCSIPSTHCAVPVPGQPTPPCNMGFDRTSRKFDAQYFGDVLDYLNGTRCPVAQDFIVIPVEEEMYDSHPYFNHATKWRNEDEEMSAYDEAHFLDEEDLDLVHENGTNSPGWIQQSFRDTFRRSFEYLLNWKLSTCTPTCNNGNGNGNGNCP